MREFNATIAGNVDDTQHNGENQTETLYYIGPDEGFDAGTGSVEPDEGNGDQYIDFKRNAQGVAHQELKYCTHHEEPDRCSQYLGDEKHPGSGPIGSLAESLLEVAVDAHEVTLIEHRHKYHGYDDVAHDETENHL